MSSPALQDLLDVAVEAAHLGGRRTLAYFNTGIDVETKSNATPVTAADREAEAVIRAHVARHFPDHTMVGEEEGEQPGDPNHRWIIDPLDGTKSFIHGVPLYGTLIGVEAHGELVAGVCYLPALDEMVYAARGMGCWWNGRRARVSEVTDLGEATMCCTSVERARAASGAYDRLARACGLTRGWGDCYAHILVATGRAEIMLDPQVAAWDIAALIPIVTEAGGQFTSWTGETTAWAGNAVSTNGRVHDKVMQAIAQG